MKKIIISLSLIVVSVLSTVAQTTNEFKLGYVTMDYIFIKLKATPAVKQAESELQTFVSQKQAMLQQSQQEIQGLYQQYQNAPEAEKSALAPRIQGLEQSYQIKEQNFQQEAAKKEQELMQPTLDKVSAAIKKVGEANGYSYVFSDGLGGNSIILFAKNKGDNLTEKVLAELGIVVPEGTTK